MSQADLNGRPAAEAHSRPNHSIAPGDYQGRQSGLVTRSAANVIDFLVTLAVLGALYVGVAAVKFLWNPRGFTFPAPSLALVILVGSGVAGVYFAVAWMATGRTYGDYVLGLRVVARNGHRMRPGLAMVRAVTCVICPIGLLWIVISPRRRSLQDVVLRTRVVYDWSDTVP